jgi:hypothetical protein
MSITSKVLDDEIAKRRQDISCRAPWLIQLWQQEMSEISILIGMVTRGTTKQNVTSNNNL